MKNKSMVKMALVAFSFMMAFSFGAYAQKTDCTKMTDVEIVDAIYVKLNVKYAAQMNHVNVRIKEGIVTIEGWVTTEKIKKDVAKIAKKVKCVKEVVNTLTIGVGGGCGLGTKPCGDICIPTNENCNIRTKGD